MYQRTVYIGELKIEWAQRSKDSAIFARLMASVQSEVFASVGAHLKGGHVLMLSRKGRGADLSAYRTARYQSREKAMAHAERWVLSRWRHIPLFVSKISQARKPESIKSRAQK